MYNQKVVTAREILIAFRKYAFSKGFTKKVVGDYAYTNRRGNRIRYKKYEEGKIWVWQSDEGIFSFELK